MRRTLALALFVCVALLPGCRMNERLSGTVFGGVGGLAIGALAAGVGGALVGGPVGAIAGYLVGDYIADGRERGRASVFGESGAVGGVREDAEHVRLAREAYERGRAAKTAPEARRWYEESLRLDEQPAALNMLALNALFDGDRDRAEAYLLRAVALDPDYDLARRNLQRLRREP